MTLLAGCRPELVGKGGRTKGREGNARRVVLFFFVEEGRPKRLPRRLADSWTRVALCVLAEVDGKASDGRQAVLSRNGIQLTVEGRVQWEQSASARMLATRRRSQAARMAGEAAAGAKRSALARSPSI